ncbi:MAG: TIGR02757 family protein [Elusimicrobia bacterium GWA2_56_46]|nr:MAG: TIGR02757 family protein [Elusimicrobia bacterium GWA2_56_46]OGR55078.1 MAG: TIGR02757 family protein [Elusimicrobia bacterium GWC2_56_31]HBB66292.1 TIGR02757 family protein [Elusimicrobiota bacterium]HBW23799.1 TIGR02757 family protein [Elusimicrobiota bacterium]
MIPDKKLLEAAYARFNKSEFIHPDPLEFVYHYEAPADREAAGFIAAALAYGNVSQILKSVEKVLAPMGPSPARWLAKTSAKEITGKFGAFKHRFTTGRELAVFLINLKSALEKHHSLENLFLKHYRPAEETLAEAVYAFVDDFNLKARAPTLTPCPEKKSSFKRLNLFLRWMVRHDAVDPGVWKKVPPAKLIVPLDTHMFQVARELGLTGRKDASMKTALEITAAFRKVSPPDPVRYDFALTRAGIRRRGGV